MKGASFKSKLCQGAPSPLIRQILNSLNLHGLPRKTQLIQQQISCEVKDSEVIQGK